jgi:DASH complex subunit SPC19
MQSATLPSTQAEEGSTEAEGEGGDVWTSKLDGIEMKGLSVVQAKKIRILKNKRERLEKERIKLGLVE